MSGVATTTNTIFTVLPPRAPAMPPEGSAKALEITKSFGHLSPGALRFLRDWMPLQAGLYCGEEEDGEEIGATCNGPLHRAFHLLKSLPLALA